MKYLKVLIRMTPKYQQERGRNQWPIFRYVSLDVFLKPGSSILMKMKDYNRYSELVCS